MKEKTKEIVKAFRKQVLAIVTTTIDIDFLLMPVHVYRDETLFEVLIFGFRVFRKTSY